MKMQTHKYQGLCNTTVFEQRLNGIAWPIKCHWAKHLPINVVIQDNIDYAAMDYKKVYVHPNLTRFGDHVLFCILAHEWAHRMVSPKSAGANTRIVKCVSEALSVKQFLAQFVSSPAIELIVDRSNCEIKAWQETYRQGFTESFTIFIDDLQKKSSTTKRGAKDILELNKMILALRLANVSPSPLPAFIRHHEVKARSMIATLFDDWNGCDDTDDPDHINRIIRFSHLFYRWIPKRLLRNQEQLAQLRKLLGELGNLAMSLASQAVGNGLGTGAKAGTGLPSVAMNLSPQPDGEIFDIALTRQVTDHLMQQAHKPRQITGLWQPGHPFSRLDLKRSARCAPVLIPGLTTRRKTDSSRLLHFERGRQLKLCLIVDDSGSMSGAEAIFSRSICEGINRFAALKAMHVGLITFGSDIDVSIPPQRRYQDLTRTLSRLNGNLGGTNLLPALQRLSHFIESDQDITHAMLITDASISDWDECLPTINKVLSQINMTVLMVNCDMPEDILKTLNTHQHTISCFKVDPSQPPNIAILEELIR
ncbi:MAG: VWA domain-containing protein [Mariprofundus sp.]|nr:VWA domain-containing protein [Mariprofundus sp.]